MLSSCHCPYFEGLVVIKCEGPYLFGHDYKKYLNATGFWGPECLGHHPAVVEAIQNQAEKMVAGAFYNMQHEPGLKLAKRIVEKMPKEYEWVVGFSNSGTEAVEAALKLARRSTDRSWIIYFSGAFHGRTYGSISAGDAFEALREKFGPVVPRFLKLTYNDPREISRLRTPRPEEVAGVIVEPIQGVGGCKMATPEFMQAIRQYCDRGGARMIVDEVQTFCRTGKYFCFEHSDVIPDIVCCAKALANGMPLGAMISRGSFTNETTWPPACHGSTYAGNPVCCAAALATLKVIDKERLIEKTLEEEKFLREELSKKFGAENIHGKGLMLAIDVKDVELRNEIVKKSYKRGLLVLKSEPSSIRLLPPLNLKGNELQQIIDTLNICFY